MVVTVCVPGTGEEDGGCAGSLTADSTLVSLELAYGEDPRWQARPMSAVSLEQPW